MTPPETRGWRGYSWGANGEGGPGERPPWWPKDEPFPPASGDWRRVRGRFVRRAVTFAVGFFTLFAFVVATFVTLLINAFSATAGAGWGAFFPFGVLAALFITFAVARGIRRLVVPLGDLVEAAESVEAGNYAVRVRARGPRELRSLARAFNSMSAHLESSEKQRQQLLADVTHELRTPLTVVQGNLEALLDGVYPADAQHLAPILDETRVLSRLVDDLRTLSIAEAGALPLHREPTDLVVLANDMLASFRTQADQAGIGLDLITPVGLLPSVHVDPVRTREILANLISNSLRHTPRNGKITVDIEKGDAIDSAAGHDHVRISVRDTGRGIAADALPHVFDRFYKSDESRGAGLGLAIAKSLVVAHGGEIHATSEPGQGTEMRFTLPASG